MDSMSFLVSKPERIRVSVEHLPASLRRRRVGRASLALVQRSGGGAGLLESTSKSR